MRNARAYDNWYKNLPGKWMGEKELWLIQKSLKLKEDESLLDIGCGTGFFTRAFAKLTDKVTGVDINSDFLEYAKKEDKENKIKYLLADAEKLPYKDSSFDASISITALPFIKDEKKAVSELIRVSRHKFALGLFNRNSLLYLRKGLRNKKSSYNGARWHNTEEAKALFKDLPVYDLSVKTAIFLPVSLKIAKTIEDRIESLADYGSFLLISGKIKK